jgi:sugar O-acyltransferase (sialic acid O-acetyltransferase NeuD family)
LQLFEVNNLKIMPPIPILVPLLNANEPEARLVTVHVKDGQPVKRGDVLFTIETTKAAADIEAPEAGFIRLQAQPGETLAVGEPLAFITLTPDEYVEQAAPANPSLDALQASSTVQPVGGLRITRPARLLAESLGIDLSTLPTDRLVTESVLREIGTHASLPDNLQKTNSAMVIYGAGGHAKAVMEMAQAIGAFRIAGIIDDNAALTGTFVLGIPVLGTREILPQLYSEGIRLAANGVGGIIDINIRVKLFERLSESGFTFPILRHPRASVEASAQIFDGVQVFANAYVGSSSCLHERCMVNTGAVVSHDCEIGSYAHIAPGAMLAGHVHVGQKALVGMGVTTAIGVTIGSGARIGNGAILLADVPARAIVPAGRVWTV